MRIDRMSGGLEAEEVLRLRTEQQKYIAAFGLADQLVIGIRLNDERHARPLGKGIVDELLRQQGRLFEVSCRRQLDPLTGQFVFSA